MIGSLVIGLVGSLHCVGMCGPIMITFVGPRQSPLTFVYYHSGRLLSYLIMGAVLGLLGASFYWFRFQQVATLMLGIILLGVYLIPRFRNTVEAWYFQSPVYRLIQQAMIRNLSIQRRWFISGVTNGLLPCGLTYVAAAGAVAVGGWYQGVLFMLLFGLGTIPALALVSVSGNLAGNRLKKYIPQAVSVIAVFTGLLLIMRGMLMTFPDFNLLVRTHAAGLITICGM